MHALLEAPSLRRPDVGVLIVPVVLDLVGITAEANHDHIDNPVAPSAVGVLMWFT